MFKKVAVVEKFFDIIYSVHVESSSGDTQLRGRAGKHCGQKRTYRAVREKYYFMFYKYLFTLLKVLKYFPLENENWLKRRWKF